MIVSKKETVLSYIVAFVLVLLMVASAVWLDDREVILPEIAAMAVGMWVYREPGWIKQPFKIFIAPSLTAVIGFAVNQLNMAYVGKVILTLALIMFVLSLIRTSLAPSIATGLLPLVINATEWTFILSVVVLTLVLMLGVLAVGIHKGLEQKVQVNIKYMIIYVLLNIIWISLVWIAGYPQLAVIPPILVVVYEVLQKPMYNGKMAFKQGLVLTVSATVGSLLYFFIDSWVLATLLAMILMLVLLRIVGIRMPAVFAFPLLPFIFPEEIVPRLPIGALVASVFFFGSLLAYKKYEIRQRSKAIQR